MKETISQIVQKRFRGTALNFGPSKTGKTEATATLVDLGLLPIWVFDFDGGQSVTPLIRKAYKLKPDLRDDDIIRFSYFPKGGDRVSKSQDSPRDQGRDMFIDFLTDFNGIYDLIGPDGEFKTDLKTRPPKAIILDSVTNLLDIILQYILCMGGTSNKPHDLNAPGSDARGDYGKQMGKIVEIVQSAKSLPLLSIFNCHEKVDQNELTGEIRIDPMITGKLSAHFAKDFDVVVYSTIKNDKYKWLTRGAGFVKSPGMRAHEGLSLEIDQDYKLVL